jgi:hypothetical protein
MQQSILEKEQAELARLEMQQRIESCGPAVTVYIPFDYGMSLIKELTAKEAIIARLKGFVDFLSKLNPKEYFRWMWDAYSHYVMSEHVKPELIAAEDAAAVKNSASISVPIATTYYEPEESKEPPRSTI